jgi:hypothetical protein
MADRFRRFGRNDDPPPPPPNGGAVATEQREYAGERDGQYGNGDANGNGIGNGTTATTAPAPAAAPTRRPAGIAEDAVVLDRDARLRQRDAYGGVNWGAAFFGWVVAIGIGVLLTAIVSAAGAAIGLTHKGTASSNAGTIGIVGGALLIAIAVVSYYAGGYVAGRMSRFDGARQGFGVWLIGLVVTLLVAGAGAVLGDQYNVFEQLNLPRIPVSTSDLTTGGAIALAAIVVGSLLAAIAGGKVGQRYHRRVDRAAVADY